MKRIRFLMLWVGVYVLALASAACATEPQGEARFLSDVRQLTFDGRRSGEGYFSADGTKMVFQSEREPGNPFYQIYLLDLETGDTQRISPGHGKTTCAWIHPDGRRVLFASTHEDPDALAKQEQELADRAAGRERRYAWDYDEHYELYAADLKTGELARLTDARGYDAEGSYSPDGQRIVFASNRHAYGQPLSEADAQRFERDKSFLVDLYIMDADGSNVQRLTESRGYDGGPFFSADGKKICWRRFSPDGSTAEIYTMNVDGTDMRQLTNLGAMSWAPYFHPSGEYLVFTTSLHGFGNFELYIVDVAGQGDPVRVTHTEGFDGLPVFSPGGARLAWTSNRTAGGNAQIFIANWDHEAALHALRSPAATPSQISTAVPSDSAINVTALRRHVEYLASEQLAGRLTGTAGERLATRYAADVFQQIGLEPAGDEGTYFQEFEFTAGVSLGRDNALILYEDGTAHSHTVDEQWRPLAFSKTGRIEEREIVFAGYGIVAPAAEGQEAYDSYAHLNVEDKWVLVFRFMPENVTPQRRQHLARHASLRHKAMVARDRGAAGLIVVSGPNAKVRQQLVPLSFDASLGGTSIAAVSVTDDVAARWLKAADKDLRKLQGQLDSGELTMGFEIPNLRLGATLDLQLQKRTGRNVLARLAGPDPASARSAIVIGAHIDHLGQGRHSGSLAGDDAQDAVHYGADDNASGVAAVLEVARYLSYLKQTDRFDLKHDILFAAWSGEELGLLGSSHFVQQHSDGEGKISDIIACLNMDMVGRLREGRLTIHGVGSSSIWPGLIERANVPVGLSITPVADSYMPTDSTSFYVAGVPALSAFTGAHEDYHTPGDTADKINYDGLEKVARFMGGVARGLAVRDEAPDYIAQARPDRGARTGALRAYLGTVPDYAQDESVRGVRITGVARGGPAEKGGLRSGDTIVELAGRKIENLYDYTYAIGALKIGEPVEIIVLRQGKEKQLTVTPESRQ